MKKLLFFAFAGLALSAGGCGDDTSQKARGETPAFYKKCNEYLEKWLACLSSLEYNRNNDAYDVAPAEISSKISKSCLQHVLGGEANKEGAARSRLEFLSLPKDKQEEKTLIYKKIMKASRTYQDCPSSPLEEKISCVKEKLIEEAKEMKKIFCAEAKAGKL